MKESRFLLGVINIYSKYDRVVLIKDKRGEATIEDPQNILRFIHRKKYTIILVQYFIMKT